MTYGTKNIIFSCNTYKVSSDSRCSRTLLMGVVIKSAHCDRERNSWEDWD